MAAISDDKYWFAVYTAPRAEKRVKERFDMAGIENYLPIQTVVRQWHDRRKKVDVPVMPGYIFVYIDRSQYKDVLMTYGALAFLREVGTPVAIPDVQIKNLRSMVELSTGMVEFSQEDLSVGTPVEITKGDLLGLVGELVEIKGKHKVAVRIQGLGYALTTLSLSFLKKL